MLRRIAGGGLIRLAWFQVAIVASVFPLLPGCMGAANAPSQITTSTGAGTTGGGSTGTSSNGGSSTTGTSSTGGSSTTGTSSTGGSSTSGASTTGTSSTGGSSTGTSTTPPPVTALNQPIVAAPGQAFTNALTYAAWQNTVHSGTYRKHYVCTSNCVSIKLLFGNQFMSDNVVAVPALAPITITASLENPTTNTQVKLTFADKSSATIAPDALLFSDAVAVRLHKGDSFYVRTFVSGNLWPTGPVLVSASPFLEGFTPGQDLTNSKQTVAVAPDLTAAYAPIAVVAASPWPPAKPTIAIVGDSIASGHDDRIMRSASTQTDLGYIVRALAKGGAPGIQDQYGYMRISAPAEMGTDFATAVRYSLRLRLVQGCTYAICEYGINDVRQGMSVFQMEETMLQIWGLLAQYGIKVYQTTITPNTLSTNQWTNESGQTIPDASHEAVRVAINNWFRDSTPAGAVARSGGNLKGIFEIADLAETKRNSGIWKPGYAADGIHPNPVGAQVLAAGINTAVLR